MKRNVTHTAIAFLLAIGTAPQLAAAADCANPRKAAASMSESVYNGVKEATDLLTQKRHAEAFDKLQKLADSGNDFDKAVVQYNLGFAYSDKNDYANATKAFSRALALNSLPQQQHEMLTLNLGQLYIVAEQWEEGIKTLQQYIQEACGPVTAQAHIFLANALSQRKRYREALPQIDQAIAKSNGPKENWLQLKLAINYELKDFKGCAETLVQLLGMVPTSGEYWRQLSGMFMELKQDREAVAVLALAERQGFIAKPQEIKNLYSIYMMIDAPYKAGALLQRAMEEKKIPADESNMDALANAWINAREVDRAEATLKKLAAMAEKGEYFYKLGAMYGDEERWKESADMLRKAIQKGGLKRTGEAWMRLAVAHYGMKDLPNTQAALQKAVNYDETRKQAGEWLRAIGSQQLASS